MDLGWFVLSAFFLATVGLVLGSAYYINRMQKFAKSNPTGVGNYGFNIIVGIVSGVATIVLDRGVTIIINGLSNINDFSWQSLLSYAVMTAFSGALVIFCVFYIINKGLPVSKLKQQIIS